MPPDSRIAVVPDDVTRLLSERVADLEELQVLLLMCRQSTSTWTAARAAAELKLSETLVDPALEALHRHDLIAEAERTVGAYRFRPATLELRGACETLLRIYDEDSLRIVMLMSRLAVERIRSSAARAFADAFKIRKPKGRGDSDA